MNANIYLTAGQVDVIKHNSSVFQHKLNLARKHERRELQHATFTSSAFF
jgi:hypothetical protein